MRKEVFGTCELYLGDCMEYMAALPDKAVDLAIVDPPYGIGKDKNHWQTSGRGKKAKSRVYDEKEWDKPPNKNYFDELFRVSKHQIIWGMQYFCENIPNTEKIIVWDKQNNGFSCSDFEAAWTSFKGKSDLFSYCWIGFSQGVWGRSTPKDKETRIHPTQKPAALYKRLLQKYAKPGWRVLDTHGGSFQARLPRMKRGLTMQA